MANLLTALRLFLVLPVAWGLADSSFLNPWVLIFLIALAIASDYFDGIVARATNTASSRGQLFDHTTDFVFVSAGLTGLAILGLINPLLPILIVFAFLQYVIDSYYLYKQKQLRMSFLGRWNGVFYFIPLVLAAASRLDVLNIISQPLQLAVTIIGYALIVSTITSIIDRVLAPLRATEASP
ncbi:MAG: hypothetical protein COA96_08665 [SAR86 cluster bacterium]|uniref:CDP-alcohol phosphatidyltransferase n=1 Tax=SAR86 cluster bacterium TaxID=2030880 RepID=A0A2A5AZJ8_9GAMM|nr:MAG: hypothetical protein COA96_08665 [SAR86 cluster bacterium]